MWRIGGGRASKLPPRASTLNIIENVWASLRGTTLTHRPFINGDRPVDAGCKAWSTFVSDQKTARPMTTRQRPASQKS